MLADRRSLFFLSFGISVVLVGLGATGCGFTARANHPSTGAGGATASSSGGAPMSTNGSGGTGGSTPRVTQGTPDAGSPFMLSDFPAAPVLDPSAPANAQALFADTPARADGAPCITSPLPGTLMPRNWLRPRFDVAAASGENLFEIVLSVPGFMHTLQIFTTSPSYALDFALWNNLRNSVNGTPITVTTRAMTVDPSGAVTLAPSAASTSSFTIAPVDAPGQIVYWALADDMGTKVGSLKGFTIGDESVETVLVPSQVATRASNDTCIGCHAATPDGNSVGFTMGSTNYFNQLASVTTSAVGLSPSYATPSALTTMQTLHGIPAYSRAHWSDGDRVVLLSDTGSALNWVQVDGMASGTLARTGDSGKVTEPAWSHDGNNVVYVSGKNIVDGRLDTGPADLYEVAYQNRAGGAAKGVPGASDPNFTEYYPSFSPDDALLAFTRVPQTETSYSNPHAEVYILPFGNGAGGTPIRLAANDPATCQTSLASPGLTNDWPKWSPKAVTAGGKTYYWLTFSSKRLGTTNAQLYITAVVVDEVGQVGTYPALYLWNQPSTDGNHTPSWDDFAIPPIG
jgi:hypothetical protein